MHVLSDFFTFGRLSSKLFQSPETTWTMLFLMMGMVTATAILLGLVIRWRFIFIRELNDRLYESERRYRQLIDSSPEGIVRLEVHGRIQLVNPSLCEIIGYRSEEILDLPFTHLLATGFILSFRESFEKVLEGESLSLRTQLLGREGRLIQASLRLFPLFSPDQEVIGSMLLVTDRTEAYKTEVAKRRLESQLRQSQKLEALGTLSGGIAHDFNNILQGILTSLEIVKKRTTDDNILKFVDTAVSFSLQGRELVSQISTFGRQSERPSQIIDVARIVREACRLIRVTLPSSIAVDVVNEDPSPHSFIIGDPTHLHQIIVNLCSNAGYSMLNTGGQLIVRIKRESVRDTEKFKPLSPGEYVLITVEDTGEGIAADIKGKIFEPFFTTKPPGEGTGMGLSVVHGLVKSHHGIIDVESTPGKGSIFSIYFPAETKYRTIVEPSPAKIREGNLNDRSILLVDDEKALISVLEEALTEEGIDVTATSDPLTALKILKSKHIDVLLTDQSMPGMDGTALAEQAKLINENIITVLCSGRLSETTPEDRGSVDHVLVKPVDVQEIRQVLLSC